MSFRKWIVSLSIVTFLFCCPMALQAQPIEPGARVMPVTNSSLGETKNVHQCGDLYLAGQFNQGDIETIKESGIRRVISLRTEGEVDWDQAGTLDQAGLEFLNVPFRAPDTLNDEVFDKVRELLSDKGTKTLFHCGSANRVGGVWLPYRVLDEGVDIETALKEAKEIGLRTEGYQQKALDYIQRKRDEKASGTQSRMKINERFLDPDMDVESFVQRFEIDNREVYAARQEILRAIRPSTGMKVADVGAGTGFYSQLFASMVGDSGHVMAIDISPKFIEYIKQSAATEGLENVSAVLCEADSIGLEPGTIDIAFVCDTYHHFEFPESTTQSIYDSLKEGGHLVIVEFERIPGKSREWILGHVRAGKETVRKEIESTGFRFVDQVEIPGLSENYFIRFQK